MMMKEIFGTYDFGVGKFLLNARKFHLIQSFVDVINSHYGLNSKSSVDFKQDSYDLAIRFLFSLLNPSLKH